MEIIVKCEISEEKIKEIIECNENHLETEQDIKNIIEQSFEQNVFETLADNEEIFTNISYEIN